MGGLTTCETVSLTGSLATPDAAGFGGSVIRIVSGVGFADVGGGKGEFSDMGTFRVPTFFTPYAHLSNGFRLGSRL